MSTPTLAASSVNGPVKKKRLLLVDGSMTKRDLRAEVMRKFGIEVDCAADIPEARSLWRADSYDLVLMNVDDGYGSRDEFCAEIRGAKPPQRVAFLVGGPKYLAAIPKPENGGTSVDPADQRHWRELVSGLFLEACEKLPQRWGIQEACWRISAVRSVIDPRSKPTAEKADASRWGAAIERYAKIQATKLQTALEAAELSDIEKEKLS